LSSPPCKNLSIHGILAYRSFVFFSSIDRSAKNAHIQRITKTSTHATIPSEKRVFMEEFACQNKTHMVSYINNVKYGVSNDMLCQ